MIVDRARLHPEELAAQTGWELRPEGLCRGERCVPWEGPLDADGRVDVRDVAQRLRLPVAHDERHDLWALGPEPGGRVLATAELPDIVLPDVDGHDFALASLRGRKVLIAAWASW